MKKNNRLRIVFSDCQQRLIPLEYRLNDTLLAKKWLAKIKHLQNIPIDPIESNKTDVSDLKQIYKEFCNFAGLQPIDISKLDQKKLNILHKVYEDTHERLSKTQNNSILYKFHHSIHFNEEQTQSSTKITVAWGQKEGPLTKKYLCNPYYEDKLLPAHVYLPWAELGKTPLQYWQNQEPSQQERINELCKPHLTFRAKFFIQRVEQNPQALPEAFTTWFATYKQKWMTHSGITRWNNIDETGAPLLAEPMEKIDLDGLEFERIIV